MYKNAVFCVKMKLLLLNKIKEIFMIHEGRWFVHIVISWYLTQAAFLLPVLTGMMKNGISGSSFSEVQEPQALVVAPTRELAVQIFMDARKFAHGTMLRAVVLYGGTSVGYQLRQVEQGTHILVGTPGRLIDIIGKGKVGHFTISLWIYQSSDFLDFVLFLLCTCICDPGTSVYDAKKI